jgi:hypothetical protein
VVITPFLYSPRRSILNDIVPVFYIAGAPRFPDRPWALPVDGLSNSSRSRRRIRER